MNATKKGTAPYPAFEAVFTEHGPYAWRLLARLGVEQRDVPDVCQEVFIVVNRRLGDFDPRRGSLRTWIYGICAREASEYRRRRPHRRETRIDSLPEPVAESGPEHELEARRAWSRLSSVLEEMEEARRLAFVLYELEALPMKEVALVMQCPLQTAYARLHSARRHVLDAFALPGEGV